MLARQLSSLLIFGSFICLLLLKRTTVETRCDNLLNFGRWSSKYEPSDQHLLWQPFDSMIQLYDQALISKCLSNRTLNFIGDSTIRQVFWAVAAKHDRDKAGQQSAEAGKHEDILYRNGNITLSFTWDPYLNSSRTEIIIGISAFTGPRGIADAIYKHSNAGIVVSTGLWHARYSGHEFASEHRQALEVVTRYTPKQDLQDSSAPSEYLAFMPVIILPPPELNHHWLNPDRAEALSPQRLATITNNLLEEQEKYGLEIAWSAHAMTINNSATVRSDGLHVTAEVAAYQAEVLLNRVCNDFLFSGSRKASSLPCVRQTPWKISAKVCFGLFSLLVITHCLVGAHQNRSALFLRRAQAVTVMTAIAYYCWLADRTTILDKGNKLVDVRLFCFCTAGVLTISFACVKAGKPNTGQTSSLPKTQEVRKVSKVTFLPRDITEEWKGWMQIVILLYHYFGMSKTLLVYQVIRVLVASYLFLTGYGHAAYFLNTQDFSMHRVAKVVVRLNMLTCLLSVVMENNHEFYYFPSLATIWFLITYAVFWRPKGRSASAKELFIRMLAMLTFSYMVLANELFVQRACSLLRQVNGPAINAREFVFRFRLDILAPFVGMCTAIVEDRIPSNQNILGCKRLELRITDRAVKLTRLALCCLAIITYICVAGILDNKPSYNRWHWVVSILPIAAYIDMRQSLCQSGGYVAPVLVWIGCMSLELFVLQYHIWLAADTKGLLRLGIFDTPQAKSTTIIKGSRPYWIETFLVTMVFVWSSHFCSRATNTLVEWFMDLGNNERDGGRATLLMRLAVVSFLLWLFKNLPTTELRR